MEYKLIGYRRSDLVRLDIKINAEVSTPAHLQALSVESTPVKAVQQIKTVRQSACTQPTHVFRGDFSCELYRPPVGIGVLSALRPGQYWPFV